MTEEQAVGLAQKALQSDRQPRQAECREAGGRKLWQIAFAGDEAPPVVVTIDDQKEEVLQVFEPLKIQPPRGIMDIVVSTDPESLLEE